MAGGADTTKDGTLKLNSAADASSAFTAEAAVAGKVDMTGIEIIGANGNGAQPAGNMIASFDYASAAAGDFKADTVKVTGGAASSVAGGLGGAAQATIAGDAIISGNVTVTGGELTRPVASAATPS